MTVSENDTVQFFARFLQVTNIGNDDVDTESGVIGKTNTAVDDDLIVAIFVDVHIFGNVSESPEGNKFKCIHNCFTTWVRIV